MNKLSFDSVRETLYTITLPNGLTIYCDPKPGFSRSFAAFATNYGGAMRRFTLEGQKIDTPQGVAHFLEHKMFDMPDGSNTLALLSAGGASPNAWTSNCMTAYHIDCTENFMENLRTLLNFVSTPWFTAESVAKEQGIIGQEIRMTEDRPGYRLYYDFLKCLYARHPVRDSVAGTVESIAQISDKTLYDCHRAFYAPSNMVLCCAGGEVRPEDIAALAEELLGSEKAPIPVPDFGEAEGEAPAAAYAERFMEVSAPQFMTGAKFTPKKGEDGLMQRLCGSVAMQYLAGRGSAFFTELYSKGLLTNNFSTDVDVVADTGTIALSGESAEPERVFERLAAEVEAIGKQGLDEGGFRRAGRHVYGQRLRSLDYFDDLCFELAHGHFEGACPLSAFELLPKVGAEDCARFICEHLSPERMAAAVVRPTPAKGQ